MSDIEDGVPSRATSQIMVTGHLTSLDIPTMVFNQLQLSGGCRFTELLTAPHVVPIDKILDDRWAVRHRVGFGANVTVLAEHDGVHVIFRGGANATALECTSTSAEDTKAMADRLRERLEVFATAPDRTRAAVRMWKGGDPPLGFNKNIITIPWADNRSNYPACVAGSINELIRLDNPDQLPGRMILWHGDPGTGKTSAIRSLIHGWQDWCTTHCVVDPDRFFDDPAYIAEVLTSDDKKQWKLVIAEDCDEYISQRPGGGVGGSLGRLLNLTDGLFGQGTNTLVLLTTNASIGRLHPAITRPGRCLSTIEFKPFSSMEAAARTGHRNAPSMTLAELYQIKNGGTMPRAEMGNRGYV